MRVERLEIELAGAPIGPSGAIEVTGFLQRVRMLNPDVDEIRRELERGAIGFGGGAPGSLVARGVPRGDAGMDRERHRHAGGSPPDETTEKGNSARQSVRLHVRAPLRE